jgi:hypothetical protein
MAHLQVNTTFEQFLIFVSQRLKIILNARTSVGLDFNVENVALGKFGVYLLRTGIYW